LFYMPRIASKSRVSKRVSALSSAGAGVQRRQRSFDRSVAALRSLEKSASLEDWEAIAAHLESAAEQGSVRSSSPEAEERPEAEESSKATLARQLTGEAPVGAELAALEMANLAEYFALRRELLQDSLTAPEVAALLRTSRQTPHDRVKAQSLVAVLERGALRFPRWQFDAQGPDGVLAGLPEVLRALALPPLAKIGWFTRTNSSLENRTPLAALQAGDVALVVLAARAAQTS
jgi:hypothetical protein